MASDRLNVTLTGEGCSSLPYRKPTPSGDIFGFHVSYTRKLLPVEFNAPAPSTVSVYNKTKVMTLPRESDVFSI